MRDTAVSMRRILWGLVRAALLGTVGYGFPRLLIALGVPLDQWIDQTGQSMSQQSWFNTDTVLWSFAVCFASITLWLDTRYGWLSRILGVPAKSSGEHYVRKSSLASETSHRQRYLTPYETMHYMADESDWGVQKQMAKTPEGLSYNVLLEAPIEFQRKASEGHVRVYGLLPESRKGHVLVDKTHWMSCGLRLETLFTGPHDECMTSPTVKQWPRGIQLYSYLKVEAEDVYRTWPKSSKLRTAGRDEGEAAFAAGFSRATFARNRAKKEAAFLRLAQLRTEGVVLRNSAANIHSTANLDLWSRQIAKWLNDVVDALKSTNAADSEWFATLDAVPPARLRVQINLTGEADVAMLISMFNQHDFRLVRLERLLKKYGIAA